MIQYFSTNNLEEFPRLMETLTDRFLRIGENRERGEWQSLQQNGHPMMTTFEIPSVVLDIRTTGLPVDGVEVVQEAIQPNLPWAENHFQERIGGFPLNPGREYKNWPWYQQGVEEHKPEGQFSHTYMERMWPVQTPGRGIHYQLGDLNDLIQLLANRPMTRQAYLPIWFPEDILAAKMGERVPCTLGYHFIVNYEDKTSDRPFLDLTYFMRSCDYFRYLRDDIYMAIRLLQHVANKAGFKVGDTVVHLANLHIFAAERERLTRALQEMKNA